MNNSELITIQDLTKSINKGEINLVCSYAMNDGFIIVGYEQDEFSFPKIVSINLENKFARLVKSESTLYKMLEKLPECGQKIEFHTPTALQKIVKDKLK